MGLRHLGARELVGLDQRPLGQLRAGDRRASAAAPGVVSMFPESNSSGNFQKVTQVIPVRIALTTPAGASSFPV
ncbi:MAG: hypothetical protein JO100_12160 [Pseudonocardia sp.]|nr:hypothetical protein [Pseudonocardia sp.]